MRPFVTIFTIGIALAMPSAPVQGGVYFADAKLKTAVEARLGVLDPTETQMMGLTSLAATGLGISDLTGLEYATNLQELELYSNQISDFSALAGLTDLRILDLSRNWISDISALSGLIHLQNLDLDYNRIGSVSPLSGLSDLVYLDLTSNQISDLSPLSGLTGLQQLELCSNQISDLSSLSGLTDLQRLDLETNRISDLSPLSALIDLHELWLGSNQISDLSAVFSLTHLHRLDLDNNQISNISSLSGFTNLEYLFLASNQVSDLSSLCRLTQLSYLDLGGNPLNQDACRIHIPQIRDNNPGIMIPNNPCTTTTKVTLEVSSTRGGSVTDPGEGEFTYEYGTGVFLTAKADPGYLFINWSGTFFGTQNPLYVTMDQDHEIQANFRSLLTTLYVDDDAPGDPKPQDPSVSNPQEKGSTNLPFDSIQEAIDVAPDRATVIVRSGTYSEDIDLLGKTIHLTGLDPNIPLAMTAYPVITGSGSGPIVRLASNEDPNCRLSGFVFSQSKALPAYTIYCSKASPSFDHCLIAGNRTSAPNGATVYCTDSQASFDHCTLADNLAGPQGAGLVLVNSNVVLTNSILWGHAPKDILLIGTSLPSVIYTDLTGGWLGLGTMDDDPLFARPGYWADPVTPFEVMAPTDPRAIWMTGDYHLRSQAGRWEEKTGTWVQDDVTSPCIDAGDPARPIGYESLPNGGIVNLGAYGGSAQASKSYIANDPVSFADATLKAAVEEALWIDNPTPSDMLGLTDLVCLNSDIKDLTGLEYATHLQSLYLRYNQISDLSPLLGLTHLQSIDLSRNPISDISPLAGLTGLINLNLHGNPISDLSPLAGLSQLQDLNLRENRITNISPLTGLTNLLNLYITFNQVCDLAPLASLNHLQSLELYGNPFTDISNLLGLTHLSILRIGWTDLNDKAYCSDIQTMLDNNPGLFLEYDPNPRPPTGVSASDGTYPDKVRITWDPVCNGPAYTSYYRVSRASSQDGPRIPLSPWQTACSFDDTSALSGTPYTYWVQTASSSQGLDPGDFSTSDGGWH